MIYNLLVFHGLQYLFNPVYNLTKCINIAFYITVDRNNKIFNGKYD
jgi:hypothetical protein